MENNEENGDFFYIKTYNKANNPINCISCDGILKYSSIIKHPNLCLLLPSTMFVTILLGKFDHCVCEGSSEDFKSSYRYKYFPLGTMKVF